MEKYKRNVLIIVAVVTLLLAVGGATFAYFQAQGGSTSQANVNVITHTTDSLTFEVGKPINIQADFTNFKEGMANRTDSTVARATLKANSATNDAKANYYIYLDITTNEFKYTTEEKTAELILTILDPNDNPVTSISGLKYVTVDGVSGFDVTEVSDLITIANNYEIHSTGTKVDEWDITLTLINLDSNQNANTGKRFNGTLLVQKEMVATQYIKSLFTVQGANYLYHHDGTLENGINDGSYRYAGGEDTTIIDANIVGEVNIEKLGTVYYYKDDIKDKEPGYVETLIEITLKVENGENITEEEQKIYNEAEENNFRLYTKMDDVMRRAYATGAKQGKIKNYVCFGTDAKNCDREHLYRIIGVIDNKVKLIKASEGTEVSLGTAPQLKEYRYSWSGSLVENNGYINPDWTKSTLNTNILNGTYLTTLGNNWIDKIAETEWKIGGNTSENFTNAVPATVYQNEVINPSTNIVENPNYTAKIGLMYISDYGFAASPENWTTVLYNYNNDTNRNNNWLFMDIEELTISPLVYPYGGDVAFVVNDDGRLGSNWADGYYAKVRPTFYLKSSVTFDGGTGTSTDPYRIA